MSDKIAIMKEVEHTLRINGNDELADDYVNEIDATVNRMRQVYGFLKRAAMFLIVVGVFVVTIVGFTQATLEGNYMGALFMCLIATVVYAVTGVLHKLMTAFGTALETEVENQVLKGKQDARRNE